MVISQSLAILHQLMSKHHLKVVQSCHPCTQERFWNSIEFAVSLVQIVAAIVVLTRAKGEHPETTRIIGYACGCIGDVGTTQILSQR